MVLFPKIKGNQSSDLIWKHFQPLGIPVQNHCLDFWGHYSRCDILSRAGPNPQVVGLPVPGLLPHPDPQDNVLLWPRTWGSVAGPDAGAGASVSESVHKGQQEAGLQPLAGMGGSCLSRGAGQQKISSPSADTSEAGPSPGCERLPLLFFFFSFFSFGLANPNRRVEVDVEVQTGVWL